MMRKTNRKTIYASAFLFGIGLLLMLFSTDAYSQVFDDFNDNFFSDSRWTPGWSSGGPTFAETNQRLEFTFPADSAGVTFDAGTSSACQLRGDFDVQVDYELITWPMYNGVRIALNIEDSNIGGIGSIERSGSPGMEYYYSYINGVPNSIDTTDLSGKLRLTRTGSTMTAYYFSAGNWVTLDTGFAASVGTVNLGLAVWSHDDLFADQEVKIAFDNVIVNAGELLCPSKVSNAPSGDQRYPWVDFNETTGESLVLWQDKRNGTFDDIYGVLLDVDGSPIGSDFAVSTASGHQQRVLVKAGGGGYLALWHDLRNQATNGADIYGAWIDGAGNVGPEMAICACASDQWNAVAGYDPVSDSFLVVWLDGRGSVNNQGSNPNDDFDLYGVVIPSGGSQSLTPFTVVSANNGQRGPQIGYDYGNGQYYLAWNDRRSGTDYDIYGARFTTSGVSLNGSGVLLSSTAGNQFRPTVTDRRPTAGISNHLVAWTDYRLGAEADVYGIHVDGIGTPVGSEIPISTHSNNEANVTADVDWINTKQSLVGYIRQKSGESSYLIRSASVDPNGLFTNHYALNKTAYEQRAEVVSYETDGVSDYGFLSVWMDQRNGTDYDIWGKKVWPSGVNLPETCHVSSDTQIQDAVISFEAEGRIGDPGGTATFELDIGQSTASPAQTAQFDWPNGAAVPFTLTYDEITNIVSFIIGGNTLTYSPTLSFSEIFIRTSAVNSDTSITVDNLIFDNGSVGNISSIAGPNGLDILWIKGDELSYGSTLKGNATMNWVVTPPSQSELAFQIMVGQRNGTCPGNP